MTPNMCMSQHYRLVSMAAQLSSIGISHRDLLPQVPLVCFPTVNSRSHPGIALQSLCSSPQPPSIPRYLNPCLGYVALQQGLSVWFSLHSDCHRSAISLSNKLICFFLCPKQLLWCEDLTPASIPSHPDPAPVLLRLLFPPFLPSSYCVLHIPFWWWRTPAHF